MNRPRLSAILLIAGLVPASVAMGQASEASDVVLTTSWT